METQGEIVTRLVEEVIEYTDLGLSKADALIVVKKDTCASDVAWRLVEARVNYCPQCRGKCII